MTDRLYYTNSYLTDFSATIIERSDDGRRIYLERTAFYPSSGGRPHDRGRLGGVEVIDVLDEGDRIAHLVVDSLLAGPVSGQGEWSRRFDHMQQHTGQHLLSAVLADLVGCQTVGVHFGRESSSLDLETAALSSEQIERAEDRVNGLVVQNLAVEVTFEEAESVAGLRKPPERS